MENFGNLVMLVLTMESSVIYYFLVVRFLLLLPRDFISLKMKGETGFLVIQILLMASLSLKELMLLKTKGETG